MRQLQLIAVLCVLVPRAFLAQSSPGTADPAFEVVSIKANASGPLWNPAERRPYQPGGRVMMTYVSLRDLVSNSYRLEVLGASGWMESERFDIVATANRDASVDDLRAMLRTMLADRFKLVARVEQRPVSGLALTISRSDGRLGPRLRSSSCESVGQQMSRPLSQAAVPPGDSSCGRMNMGPGQLAFRGLTMMDIAERFSAPAGAPVGDRTGLAGTFDVDVEWTADPAVSDGVPFITAIQEQLGLKLSPATISHDVVRIISAGRPKEN